ncbi:MAG: hypothetical protein AAF934_03360 [Bacteroidota bacterium]
MKLRTFLWVMALSTALIACKDDDNDRFSIEFDNEVYEATFRTLGETEPVTITSDIGTPEIVIDAGTDPAISYNMDTGILSWSELLPLDETSVTLVATSGSRETTTTIMINNSFAGEFSGSFADSGMDITFIFNADVLTVNVDGNEGDVTSWDRNGYGITVTYSIAGLSTTLSGTINPSGQITGQALDNDGQPIDEFTLDMM